MSQTLLDPDRRRARVSDTAAAELGRSRTPTAILVTRGELVRGEVRGIRTGHALDGISRRGIATSPASTRRRSRCRVWSSATSPPRCSWGCRSSANPRTCTSCVIRPRRRAVGRGVRTHTAAVPRETISRGGLQLTSLAETTVDVARSRHRAIGLAVVDAALRSDCRAERRAARRHERGRARAAAGDAMRGGRSTEATPAAARALESISRAVVEFLGFAEPELQVPFDLDGRHYFVDCFWPDARIVGEADGRAKYDGAYGDTRPHRVRREAPGGQHPSRRERVRALGLGRRRPVRCATARDARSRSSRRIRTACADSAPALPEIRSLSTDRSAAALNGHRSDRETG